MNLTNRKREVWIAILFFVQMITFAIGSAQINSFTDSGGSKTALTMGVVLEACSGLAVVAIGLLMYRVLKLVNKQLAVWYPVFRVAELTVSAICGIYLLHTLKVVPNSLLWLYIPTGIGGVLMTYLLYVSKLVPRPIAVLGLIGYAALLIGVPLDLLGVLRMDKGAGLGLMVPGGLFEFIFFPIWLLAKGFNLPEPAKAPTLS